MPLPQQSNTISVVRRALVSNINIECKLRATELHTHARARVQHKGIAPKLKKYNLPRHLWHLLLLLYTLWSALQWRPNARRHPIATPPIRIYYMRFTHVFLCVPCRVNEKKTRARVLFCRDMRTGAVGTVCVCSWHECKRNAATGRRQAVSGEYRGANQIRECQCLGEGGFRGVLRADCLPHCYTK